MPTGRQPRPILVVAGMAREVRLATGSGTVPIGSGGLPDSLREQLSKLSGEFAAVLSFGIAGGLQPGLRPGQVIVANAVVAGGSRWPADTAITGRLAEILAGGVPLLSGDLAGSDVPLVDAAAKRDLQAATGAAAVDMESHVAAAYASERGLPFAALRAICDPAERNLPALTATALLPSGAVNYPGLLKSLMRNPAQLAAVPRLAADAASAFRALSRCRDLLGIGRGLPDLRELLGDVA